MHIIIHTYTYMMYDVSNIIGYNVNVYMNNSYYYYYYYYYLISI